MVNLTIKTTQNVQSLCSESSSFIPTQHGMCPYQKFNKDLEMFKKKYIDTQMQNIPSRAKRLLQSSLNRTEFNLNNSFVTEAD